MDVEEKCFKKANKNASKHIPILLYPLPPTPPPRNIGYQQILAKFCPHSPHKGKITSTTLNIAIFFFVPSELILPANKKEQRTLRLFTQKNTIWYLKFILSIKVFCITQQTIEGFEKVMQGTDKFTHRLMNKHTTRDAAYCYCRILNAFLI